MKVLRGSLCGLLAGLLMLGCHSVKETPSGQPLEPEIKLPKATAPRAERLLAYSSSRVSQIRDGKVRIGTQGWYSPAKLAGLCDSLGAEDARMIYMGSRKTLSGGGNGFSGNYNGCGDLAGEGCRGLSSGSGGNGEAVAIIAVVAVVLLVFLAIYEAGKEEMKAKETSESLHSIAVTYNRFLLDRLNLPELSPQPDARIF